MEDPVFKQKYQKCKLRVKLWEKDFKKKHGRVPSKYDIREASQKVRDSYKMYYKLKTSFLEDTLNDVLSDDGFDILEMSQPDAAISLTESMKGQPQLPLDITKLVEPHEDGDTMSQENCSKFLKIVDTTAKEFQPVKILPLNDHAWAPSVDKNLKEKKELTFKSLKPNFKEKLFKNSSFSIRNPRKSLSKCVLNNSVRGNPINTSEAMDSSNKEALPDLETILLQKAREQQVATVLALNPLLSINKSKENIKIQVDEGWLERNTDQNEITKENSSEIVNNEQEPCKKPVYGLSNFNLSKLDRQSISLPEQTPIQTIYLANINSNSNLESAEISLEKTKKLETVASKFVESDSVVDDSEEEEKSQKYRHIIKKRKLSADKTQGRQVKAKSELELFSTICDDLKKNDSSSDWEQKNETKTRVKRIKVSAKNTYPKLKNSKETIKKVVTKEKCRTASTANKIKTNKRFSKRKVTESTDWLDEELEEKPLNTDDLKYTLALESCDLISVPRVKQTDLDNIDNLAQKYISSVTPTPGIVSSLKLKAVDEKRDAARRKLEEKIANGKLNENFVTINIQKKKFVRGKKTVSYSKYKKKLWKHKKEIAALSGPNMDMGGCDGGVLKCFKCGQVGHFAQNCKVKGDALLPLTAQLQEDVSPFPTLDEAERMASELAASVHSRNIEQMPQAANTAIYNQVISNKSDDNEDSEIKVSTLNNSPHTKNDENVAKEIEDLMETDDEIENFDIQTATLKNHNNISPIKKYVGSKIPDDFLKAAGIDINNPKPNSSAQFRGVSSLYDLNDDGTVKEATTEVLEALRMFGHSNFRKGQDRAVMRILSGMSTLVTLSTGSGKSLCYQLPAYLYSKHKKCITLVISPLVSLMEDQVTGVPHFLRAHCLHTNQTNQQKVKIMNMIAEGEIDILLVSPEAVVAGERSTGFGSILRQLPPIAFACIDEVHCVSQWSHNFRTSYLMICKVLRKNLGVKCILGLTATATLLTRESIISYLGIMDGTRGIISDTPLPNNLILSVSKDENRDSALLQLLLSKRFQSCQSIIIYCTRRDECERIAAYLRTCLQDYKAPEQEINKKKRKRVNWQTEPYHAGMPSSRRRTIQNAFMRNELRIVVATIAFGMGINKPDIRAVIHYNMPSNFESYVQEVGRAGRDNKISHCHLFLDANGSDKNELKRHIYANSLDRHVIRKLLQHIFVPCCCDKTLKNSTLKSSGGNDVKSDSRTISNASTFDSEKISKARNHICQGHEIGVSIEKTVEALDIPEENISTLLCYMELENRWCINVLSNAYIKAKIISYGGAKYLKYAAKESPPLAMAIAMEIKNGTFKEDANIIEFSVIDIAAAIGWNSGIVKYHLKNLEWIQVNGYPKRSPITVTFYDIGFRIKAPGDFTAEEIDDALDTLYNRSVKQEHTQLKQLQYIFQGLSSVAYNSCSPCCSEIFSEDRSDQLKGIIRDYFCNDYHKNLELEIDPSNVSDAELESDVNNLINMYPENNFSGRNIARIFHGISSPNYPAMMWHRCRFWRVHSKADFNRIVHLANNVIVRRRT